MTKTSEVQFPYLNAHKKLFYNLEEEIEKINIIKKISMIIFILSLGILTILNKPLADGFNFKWNLITLKSCVLILLIYNSFVWINKLIIYKNILRVSRRSFNETFYMQDYLKPKFKKIGSAKQFVIQSTIFILSPDSFSSKYFKDCLKIRFYNARNQIEISNLKKFKVINRKTQNPTKLYYSIEGSSNSNEFNNVSALTWSRIRIERKFFIEWSNWANILLTIYLVLIVFILVLVCESTYMNFVGFL